MLPGRSAVRSGRPASAAARVTTSSVASVLPPSTKTISSGRRVCAAIAAMSRPACADSFSAVTTSETRTARSDGDGRPHALHLAAELRREPAIVERGAAMLRAVAGELEPRLRIVEQIADQRRELRGLQTLDEAHVANVDELLDRGQSGGDDRHAHREV